MSGNEANFDRVIRGCRWPTLPLLAAIHAAHGWSGTARWADDLAFDHFIRRDGVLNAMPRRGCGAMPVSEDGAMIQWFRQRPGVSR